MARRRASGGDAGPDRQAESLHGFQRRLEIRQIDHHFKKNDVGPRLGHDRKLTTRRLAHAVGCRHVSAPAPVGYAGRDQGILPAGFGPCLDRQFDGAPVICLEPRFLAGSFKRVKVRCKTVADDHLGAGGKIVEMDLPHDIRMAQRSAAIPGVVELRHTAPLGFGSGGAVDQDAFTSRNPLHYFIISRHEELGSKY